MHRIPYIEVSSIKVPLHIENPLYIGSSVMESPQSGPARRGLGQAELKRSFCGQVFGCDGPREVNTIPIIRISL